MKTAKIKNWINCNIKREHIYDLGTNPERWEAECERQLRTVGYIECRCMYCGRLLMRIVPKQDQKEEGK